MTRPRFPKAYEEFSGGLGDKTYVPSSPTASFLTATSEYERWKKEVPEEALPFFIERHRFHTDVHVFVGETVKIWAEHAYVYEWPDFTTWRAEMLEVHQVG